MERTGFLGLSHLGLVSSICWASFDQPVLGVDVDRETVDLLNCSTLPIYEPGLAELLERYRDCMVFTTDPEVLAECPLVIISRDVPTDAENVSDPLAILDLVDRAIPHVRSGVALVLMSQVRPGFTRALGERIRGRRPDLLFDLYYWVETLILGNAVERYLRPERIILGSLDPDAPLPVVLETALRRFTCPILPMSYESAELAKAAINLYLCGSVAYTNTLSDLCEAIGADWSEIVPALRMDKRIGPAAYLRPSLGVSGGNLERDLMTLQSLCQGRGVDATFIDALVSYNTQRCHWVLRMLNQHVFDEIDFPTIAIWGLAYKKNTRSMKNSSSLRVIADLRGRALVRAYDPVVRVTEAEIGVSIVASREEALTEADGLLIMTDWDEFAKVDGRVLAEKMRRPVVIDCVGVLHEGHLRLDGVRYISMGRGAREER